MARPTKQGIDFFSLDTDFDDDVEMYILEKEAAGLSTLVAAWQLIYRGEGYYIKHDHDLLLKIKKRTGLDPGVIKDCLNSCLARNIFNQQLAKKQFILTSSGVQKRFFSAAKQKKEVKYNPKYILIDVNPYDNLININGNGQNIDGNATKEKEEEKEEVKGKVNIDININPYVNDLGNQLVKPEKTLHKDTVYLLEKEYQKLIDEYGLEFTEKCIDKLDRYKGANGKKYKSDYKAILNWVVDAVKKGSNNGTYKNQTPRGTVDHDKWREELIAARATDKPEES